MSGGALLLKAVAAGFIVAVPIGAIGALCIRHALHGRWVIGLLTGLGAAVADCLLAAAAMFGLSLIVRSVYDNQNALRLAGGVLLIGLGIWMVRKSHQVLPPRTDGSANSLPPFGEGLAALATGFALTIINPATFLAFGGVLAAFGLFESALQRSLAAWLVVGGVFAGSMLWWINLTCGMLVVRRRMPQNIVAWIEVVLGGVVVLLGLLSLVSALWNR